MNLLEWAGTIVLLELAIVLLVLAVPVLQYIRAVTPDPPKPPTELPPPPAEPGVTDPATLRLLSVSGGQHPGDSMGSTTFTINTDGAVYEDWRFDRMVDVKAEGVVFRNCYFEGVAVNPSNTGLLRCITGGSFEATHCTMRPRVPNDGPDGVRGSNFSLRGCDISGTVDGIHIYGDLSDYDDPNAGNVEVTDTWLHDFVFYDNDSHSDGTHNDCVQIVGGSGITFRGNRFSGTSYNAVFMVTQGKHRVADLTIEGNLVESDGKTVSGGGQQTVSGLNLYDEQGPGPVVGLRVVGNTFKKGAQKYPLLVDGRTLDSGSPVISGNVYEDGSAVVVLRA